MKTFHVVWLLAALGYAGCQPVPPPAPDNTGSNEAVTEFFEAVVRQDWPRGFAVVAVGKSGRISAEQFSRQGEAYRKRLGFEPEEVHVRSCEEHESEAIAHVTLVGHTRGQRKQFRESVVLRRSDGKWAVVRPNHFGN